MFMAQTLVKVAIVASERAASIGNRMMSAQIGNSALRNVVMMA